MNSATLVRTTIAGCMAAAAVFSVTSTAVAQNATQDSAMAPNYTIEARVYKDWGVAHPTHWTTSVWAYHGAALQSMTRIRDTTTMASSVGSFTFTCQVGLSTGGPTGNCTGNASAPTYNASVYWENGGTYESDLVGVMNPQWNTTWEQVCSNASAYSSSLGIHGTTQACIG